MKDGILIVNKPSGMTSHDVVDFVRKRLKIRRVGHAGTLDPIATGVLLILIGRCTKLFASFSTLYKSYTAVLTLGQRTDSGDREGKIIQIRDYRHVDEEKIKAALRFYTGKIYQVPPMVSALKHKGKRLYALARQGLEVNRKARLVEIKELKLLEFRPPEIKFYLSCSKGTYVRQLAEDVAFRLDCVGHISEITRQSIGIYDLSQTCELSQINESSIRPYKMGSGPIDQ